MARTFDPFREIFGEAPRTVGMPMDLVRTGDDFVVSVDLPGVDPSSIDIDAEERTLTIRATRNTQSSDGQWLVRERPTGTFARQLTLGNGLALDRVKAGYADGVLTLHIPVAEEAKPRKITVTHTGGQQSIEGEVAQSTEHEEPMAS
jgi:HSP20 family protein